MKIQRADAGLLGQRMGGGQHGHQLALDQRHRVKALVGQNHKAQLHAALQQPLQHHAVHRFFDMHLDQWMGLAKCGQQLRQQAQRGCRAKRGDLQALAPLPCW